MDNTINRTFVKTISWASIFAGVLAVLAISFCFHYSALRLDFLYSTRCRTMTFPMALVLW